MSFLKQVATGDNGTAFAKPWHGVTATRLVPNTVPTDGADVTPAGYDEYAAWVAKNYSTTLRTYKSTQTGYRCKYDFGQMWRYHKILKRHFLYNRTRMAA
jgi:hypothetical protein